MVKAQIREAVIGVRPRKVEVSRGVERLDWTQRGTPRHGSNWKMGVYVCGKSVGRPSGPMYLVVQNEGWGSNWLDLTHGHYLAVHLGKFCNLSSKFLTFKIRSLTSRDAVSIQ